MFLYCIGLSKILELLAILMKRKKTLGCFAIEINFVSIIIGLVGWGIFLLLLMFAGDFWVEKISMFFGLN